MSKSIAQQLLDAVLDLKKLLPDLGIWLRESTTLYYFPMEGFEIQFGPKKLLGIALPSWLMYKIAVFDPNGEPKLQRKSFLPDDDLVFEQIENAISSLSEKHEILK